MKNANTIEEIPHVLEEAKEHLKSLF